MAKRVKVLIAVVAAVAASCVAFGVRAGTATVSVNPSPYDTSGCAAIDAAQQAVVPGIYNYRNSEVEPQLAVDPTDPSHMIGVWQQDRWTDGGNNGEVSAYSTTGGGSWTVVPQPFSACYQASGYGPSLNYQRASDPWVSIGPGKPGNACTVGTADCTTAYSVSLVFDETDARNGVAASVSYNGGAMWQAPVPIIQDPCSGVTPPAFNCNPKTFILNDKESVTADPTHPGVAYAVWDRLAAPPASFPGFFRELAYKGPAYFSKTTDFGQTWSAPQRIVTTPSIDQTIGNVIVVDPTNDTLYDFFTYIQNFSNAGGNRGLSIAMIKSTDQGATWSGRQIVAPEPAYGVADPNNLDPSTNTAPASLRTGSILPEPAVNPMTGQLYIVWEGADTALGEDVVYITTSNDGGAKWSTPAVVNSSTAAPAYTPSIAVTPIVTPLGSGTRSPTLYVTFYQWDAATTSGAEPTTLYLSKSTSAGDSTTPPTFGAQTAISGEFNGLAAAWAFGYFLGDYEGLGATSSGFVALNVLTNCDDGGGGAQPSCRALSSVVNPTSLTPTGNNAQDVFAITGS